jgi:hypothetical protein
VYPDTWESVQPAVGMPVKHTQLLLDAGKLLTQIGSLGQSAVRMPFFAVLDGVFFRLVLEIGFVFRGLLADPFLTFFLAPVAALRAAFFEAPLDFFFFFFKILLLSSRHR